MARQTDRWSQSEAEANHWKERLHDVDTNCVSLQKALFVTKASLEREQTAHGASIATLQANIQTIQNTANKQEEAYNQQVGHFRNTEDILNQRLLLARDKAVADEQEILVLRRNLGQAQDNAATLQPRPPVASAESQVIAAELDQSSPVVPTAATMAPHWA